MGLSGRPQRAFSTFLQRRYVALCNTAEKTINIIHVYYSPQMRPVLYKDFQAALEIVRPSVSAQDLDLYVEWNRQFGCGRR